MGQYYKICNIDKKEFLVPNRFGDGLKLLEFGSSGSGTMCGLAILLANSNGRGGGDLNSASPVVGRWAGDRIVIAGDYGDPWVDEQELLGEVEEDGPPLYQVASDAYKDISEEVLAALSDNKWIRADLEEKVGHYSREKLPVAYGERNKITD